MRGRRDLPCLATLHALAISSKSDSTASDIIMTIILPHPTFTNESLSVAASQMKEALTRLMETCPTKYEKERFNEGMDNFFGLFNRSFNYKAKGTPRGFVIPSQEQADAQFLLTTTDPNESANTLAVLLSNRDARAETGETGPKSSIEFWMASPTLIYPSARYCI